MNDPVVYMVDDDASLRDATSLFLRVHGIRSLAFASAEEFLDTFRPEAAGCILLDLKMPGMGGLELHRALIERSVAIPVVVVTAHGDVATARAALKAGAFDFLEKPVENDMLLEVISHALGQDRQYRHRAAAMSQNRQRIGRLTLRERQVMHRVARGSAHREVAAALGISPRTVEVYKMRLMAKLQARTLADVIRIADDDDAPP